MDLKEKNLDLADQANNIEWFGGKFLVSKELLSEIEKAPDDGFDLLTKITPQQINTVSDSVFQASEVEYICNGILELLKYTKGNTFSPFTLEEYKKFDLQPPQDLKSCISLLVQGGQSEEGNKIDAGYLVRIGEDICFTNKFIKAFVKNGIHDREKATHSHSHREQVEQAKLQSEQEKTKCELLLNLIAKNLKQDAAGLARRDLESYIDVVTDGKISLIMEPHTLDPTGKVHVEILAHPGLFPTQQKHNFAESAPTSETHTVRNLIERLRTFDTPTIDTPAKKFPQLTLTLTVALNFRTILEKETLRYAKAHPKPNHFDKSLVGYLGHMTDTITRMIKEGPGTIEENVSAINKFIEETPDGGREFVSKAIEKANLEKGIIYAE